MRLMALSPADRLVSGVQNSSRRRSLGDLAVEGQVHEDRFELRRRRLGQARHRGLAAEDPDLDRPGLQDLFDARQRRIRRHQRNGTLSGRAVRLALLGLGNGLGARIASRGASRGFAVVAVHVGWGDPDRVAGSDLVGPFLGWRAGRWCRMRWR